MGTGQLNGDQIQFLTDAVSFLTPARVEEALIDEDGFKAIDDSSTMAVIASEIPAFPGKVALSRIHQLKSRIDLVKGKTGFAIDYVVESRKEEGNPDAVEEDVISSFDFSAGSTHARYRAGNPFVVRAPKRPALKTLAYFGLSDTTVGQIQSAVAAYGPAKEIGFVFNGGNIAIELQDDNGEFTTNIGTVEGFDEKVSYVYNAERISVIFKLGLEDGTLKVGIGERGLLEVERGCFSFYLMPSSR
jgi:hypothetical protein